MAPVLLGLKTPSDMKSTAETTSKSLTYAVPVSSTAIGEPEFAIAWSIEYKVPVTIIVSFTFERRVIVVRL